VERKIVEVLSHNVVLAKLSSGNNSIVFGKGIGFKKKPGDAIDPALISQEFLLHTTEAIEHYQQVIEMVNFPIIAATEEVIAMAIQRLPGPFSDTIHAALIDHVHFAVERYKKGIYLSNPFTYEIRYLYPEDYAIAEQAVAYLNEKLDVNLPEEEVAFLAIHFHSARAFTKSEESLRLARMVSMIVEELKREGLVLRSSFETVRLFSHLKALITRVNKGKSIDNPLLANIREHYPDSFAKARAVGELIAEQLRKPVPDEEIGFLTLHLERLRYDGQDSDADNV
jgi:transcriptional antiterminator